MTHADGAAPRRPRPAAVTQVHGRVVADTLEDLTFLADQHVGITEAARRTGFPSRHAVEKWLRAHDHQPLATRLARLDPLPLVDAGPHRYRRAS